MKKLSVTKQRIVQFSFNSNVLDQLKYLCKISSAFGLKFIPRSNPLLFYELGSSRKGPYNTVWETQIVVLWLKYCRYGVKHQMFNQSNDHSTLSMYVIA